MSYQEYKNMFEKCQDSAPYHLFVYDMKNSRLVEDKIKRQSDMAELLFATYNEIENIEKNTNKTILHKSDDLNYCSLKKTDKLYDIEYPFKELKRADLIEPFIISGDLMGFTIERGSLNSLQVDYIFEEKKKELGLNYSFHKADGFYETDKWEEANKKYFRGYAICQLEENSKIKDKKIEKDKLER